MFVPVKNVTRLGIGRDHLATLISPPIHCSSESCGEDYQIRAAEAFMSGLQSALASDASASAAGASSGAAPAQSADQQGKD